MRDPESAGQAHAGPGAAHASPAVNGWGKAAGTVVPGMGVSCAQVEREIDDHGDDDDGDHGIYLSPQSAKPPLPDSARSSAVTRS
jgi:hypothetical protein